MRHAAAGNPLRRTLATSGSHHYSHTPAAQPAAVGMSLRDSPFVGEMGELGRWRGPLLTVLDARECHSLPGRATPSGYSNSHTLIEGRRCVSEPASSQPG
ncbi:MAG: hypothetical protein ACI9PP_001172 [Halobacteriales archaeon]|jgi:hypothetical protein